MSIHNLPPLITQTPERIASDEVKVVPHLGEIGIEKYYEGREPEVSLLSVLPTRDSVRYVLDRIRNVILVGLQDELDSINGRLYELDAERANLFDQRQALKERAADLSLFEGSILNDTSKLEKLSDAEQVLEARERELLDRRESALAKRTDAILELEKLEDEDFRLLQQGK